MCVTMKFGEKVINGLQILPLYYCLCSYNNDIMESGNRFMSMAYRLSQSGLQIVPEQNHKELSIILILL